MGGLQNLVDYGTSLKREIRDFASSAAMKGYWIGIARQYFLFNFRQNTVAG